MPALGAGELVAVPLGLALIALPFVVWALLVAWSRRLAARHGATSAWRRVWILPVAGLLAQILGCVVYGVVMVGSFALVGEVDAASRATVLARSISTAMNAGALGAIVALAFFVVSLAALVVGQLTTPKR